MMSEIYILDMKNIRDRESFLLYFKDTFKPLLDECALNLDAFWDELGTINIAKIIVKNQKELRNLKDYENNIMQFLNALKDSGWQIEFEPTLNTKRDKFKFKNS